MLSALKEVIFSKDKLNRSIEKSLGKTKKSYGAQLVQQLLRKKVSQKTGEVLDVCGTSQRNLLP